MSSAASTRALEQTPLLENSQPASSEKTVDGAADVLIVFKWGDEHKDHTENINGDDLLSQVFVDQKQGKTAFKRLVQVCEGKQPPLKEVREAFLHDITEWLTSMGLNVKFFLSQDQDELFMRVAIDDPVAQEYYAEHYALRLQITDEVRRRLNIDYDVPPGEVDYFLPRMPFAKDLVRDKKEELGVPELFKLYKLRDPKGSMLMMIERIRIINRIIDDMVDFEDLEGAKVVVGMFPVHMMNPCQELRSEWANFQLKKLLNPWPVQPLDRIAYYFGLRVAFMFAWIGATIRMLSVLAIFGLVGKLVLFLELFEEAYVTLAWGGVMVMWAAAYMKVWSRTEHSLAVRWDSRDAVKFQRRLPSFRGEVLPSPLDKNVRKRQYPKWKQRVAIAFGQTVTIIFCGLACVAVSYIQALRKEAQEIVGDYGLTAVSLSITVTILVFNFIFGYVAEGLVWLENPEIVAEYANSMIVKKFSFQFINSYNAFIYVAFVQRTAGLTPCPDDDCIDFLSSSLMTTYMSLAASTIVSMFLPFVQLWWSLRKEQQKAAKVLEAQGKKGEEIPDRGFMEIQAKMAPFTTDTEIDDMLALVIAVGYVLLFAGVCPGVVVIAMLVFMVQLRASAWKLCRVMRRPFPIRTNGLGAWNEVLNLLTWLGMLGTVLIPILNMPFFDDWSAAHKFLCFFGTEHLFICLRLVVGRAIDDDPSAALLMENRRQYTLNKLLIGNVKLTHPWDAKSLDIPVPTKDSANHLEDQDDWPFVDKIPNITLFPSQADYVPGEETLSPDRDGHV